jgi:hypothetical protein
MSLVSNQALDALWVNNIAGIPDGAQARVRLRPNEFAVCHVRHNGETTAWSIERDQNGKLMLGKRLATNRTLQP